MIWHTKWGKIKYRSGNMDEARQAGNVFRAMKELVPMPKVPAVEWTGLQASFAIDDIQHTQGVTYQEAEQIYIDGLPAVDNPNDEDYLRKINSLEGRAILAEFENLIDQGCIIYGETKEEKILSGFIVSEIRKSNPFELVNRIRLISEVTQQLVMHYIVLRKKTYKGDLLLDVWNSRKPLSPDYDIRDDMIIVAEDLCIRFGKSIDSFNSLSINDQAKQLAAWIQHTWHDWLQSDDREREIRLKKATRNRR